MIKPLKYKCEVYEVKTGELKTILDEGQTISVDRITKDGAFILYEDRRGVPSSGIITHAQLKVCIEGVLEKEKA